MVGKRGFIYEANLLKMQTQISMYPEQVIKKKKKNLLNNSLAIGIHKFFLSFFNVKSLFGQELWGIICIIRTSSNYI